MSKQGKPLQAIQPVKPAAAYIGGKKILSARIIELINKTPHTGYAEAFVGMGGVFLRRDNAPKTEVINDFSGDVANFFRILQRHYPQFMEMLRFQITSRREFERLAACNVDTLTDLERAARFLYLQRTAFGGKVAGRNFGIDRNGGGRFNIIRLETTLEDIHERLSGVVIECLPWEEFIKRWNRPGMLFYLDPPYFGSEKDYGAEMFSRDQFEQMAAMLATIKGRFILSLNDHPEVRRTFKGFKMKTVPCTYSVSGGAGKSVKELIITGGG